MRFGEYLKSLEGGTVTLAAQQRAQEYIKEFQAFTHIDRATETGGSVWRGLGKDLIDLTTGLPLRVRAYRLHREVGLSTLQALRHSSPVEGLEAAVLVVPPEPRR